METSNIGDAPVPDGVVGEFPVSTTQQRCWFLDQINPGNPALNVAVRWEVRGRVSDDSLERAFQHVIDRHEILRTRFVERDGTPMQQVVEEVSFRLGKLDVRTTPEPDRMARIDTIAHEEGDLPFDLTQPGLIRATLVRFDAERAMLLIVAHQSCFDGHSIGVLGREIGTAAAAFEAGETPDLPELPLQYGDFALWQKEYHDSGVLEDEGAYWEKTLKDAPYFEIATDKPRPPVQSPVAKMMTIPLPDGFAERLEERARAEKVTTFAFGCAVASACLHRISGASEVLMGTQIAGRNDVDLDPLIGVFINNLVLRFSTASDETLRSQLAQSKHVVEGALMHQNLPFNMLVERLNPVRDASRNPLISVNFNLLSVFLQGKSYGTFELISVPSHAPGSVYDLQFIIIGRPSGWQLSVEYATELFETATVERMLNLMRDAFNLALENPDMRLSDIPLDPVLSARRDADTRGLQSVEQALQSHPLVDEVVAVPAGEGVYAFVTPEPSGTLPLEQLPGQLMSFASSLLPAEDLPSGISIMAGFPRTSRGDVNRSILRPPALPATRSAPSTLQPAAQVTTDPNIEARLKEHWKEILSVSDVPATASFFDLGGHSLLAVRLLLRIRQEWGLELGIAAIYEHATLADLAAHVSSHVVKTPGTAAEQDDWRILRLSKDGQGAPLTAINNAATVLAVLNEMPQRRPATCVRLFDGKRGLDQGNHSFEEIAAEYAKVIRQAQPEGPYLLFGICVHGNVALEAARILKAQGHEILGVVVKDVWEPGFAAGVRADRKASWQDKIHSLKNRIRMVRSGTLSLSAMLGSYRLVRMTGILQLGVRLGLIDRVRGSDLEAEQERFIQYLSSARDVYRPAPLDIPVLHVVTNITPQGGSFLPSIGWEKIVTGRLKTVHIDEVLVHQSHRIGTAELAHEIEVFLSENEA